MAVPSRATKDLDGNYSFTLKDPEEHTIEFVQYVFAPPAAENHPLTVVQFRAWRVKEPVSNRRYTGVRLQSLGGTVGHGEGGPVQAAEIVAARAAVMDRRGTESEYIRVVLRGAPALEAAVSNAMIDLVSREKKTYRSTRIRADRSGSRPLARSSGRWNRRRIPAVAAG